MSYKLIVSKDASRDVDEIARYIALELDSPQAASAFLNAVEKSYHTLVDNPRLFALCGDTRLQREGYRKVVVKNHLILYRIDEEQQAVLVTRVIYGPRNYAKLL